jgi:hypothetical protein
MQKPATPEQERSRNTIEMKKTSVDIYPKTEKKPDERNSIEEMELAAFKNN